MGNAHLYNARRVLRLRKAGLICRCGHERRAHDSESDCCRRCTCDGFAAVAEHQPEEANVTLDLDPEEDANFGPGNPADYGDNT